MQINCLKYRLYPNKTQKRKLEQTLDICRGVYNSLLNNRKFQYEANAVSVSWYDQKKAITTWKPNHPELILVHSQVLQDVSVRVDLAYKAFFRRVKAGETPGFPRAKGPNQYESFCYPGTGYQVVNSGLKLSKITGPNQMIKMKLHRPLVGKVKTCCIHKVNSKWFVCFSVEQTDEMPLIASNLSVGLESVGIDMGLRTFATLSTGEQIENPRFFRTDEPALAKAGRKQAKQKKGSIARKKCNKVLARIHERIRNRRHNFCHQAARKIVNTFDFIAIENLNVRGMVKNHSLAKSISDAAWSQFLSLITVKAESAGRWVVRINPAYTSQDCHQCGYRAKKKLSERWHTCPMCSASLDRDHNAAINILALALKEQNKNLTGTTVSQVLPVEAPAFTHGE